jgi:asparagine synthase (glutamine-hydrolysing)
MQPLLSSALRGLGNNRLKRISSLLEPVPPSKIRSHIFSQEQYYFTEEEIRSHLLIHQEPQSFSYSDDPNLTLNGAEKQALFDIKYYLKDDLLVKVDRSSMYYALECRCPFLDREVVHLALNLPYKFKKRDGERKWILKQWLKEYLPDELIFRPKKGFGIPLHRWLRGDLKYLLHDYLSEEVIDQLGLFKKDYILELVKRFHHGEWYLFNRLWLIIVLHKWIKENA